MRTAAERIAASWVNQYVELCQACHAPMLRWSWWEHPDEPHRYWYCLECDKAGRTPFIVTMPVRRPGASSILQIIDEELDQFL